ncbi:MAG: serine protein kinase PrkA [Planctomycetes bacterium]|jgi:predicted Ser/Thr protein kinase|nr:serine protein kinase PrkA [Planctomycetota bacterium]
MPSDDILASVAERQKADFAAERRLLTFAEWIELFAGAPYRHARSAAQYVADVFEHFGVRPAEAGTDDPPRFLLFDQAFAGGEGRVHGQEAVQERVCRLVRSAAEAGRSEKMIVLHGPNGSGKSVLVEAIFHALEAYSRLPEGVLYRFAWVFPRSGGPGDRLGFGGSSGGSEPDSFAHLPGEEVSARLVCEMKDHPLFLLPGPDRERALEEALSLHPEDRGRSFRHVLRGELCQKCRGIYEGLLAGYQGDWRQVIRHVQVERYFVSQRYRQAALTIHPVGSVDALEQQVTADFSAQNLPPVLQNLKLFEAYGDLVAANGGAVEFGDLLKRPPDFNKYLLGAAEKGTVNLANTNFYLNVVMLATTNDLQLDAFKSTPEWGAFKGRMELVPVPYILRFTREAELYRDMLAPALRKTHVAPHALETAGLWAVLTRLLPPEPRDLEPPLAEVARSLTPLEKALLYDRGEVPARLGRDDRKNLRAGARALRRQHEDHLVYEGRFGASPREMRMVLSQALFDSPGTCLTVARILPRIEDLVRDRSLYEFLNIEPRSGYHDARSFISSVSRRYSELVLLEIQDAMDLIREEEYDRRFDEYLSHVIAFVRGERVRNVHTGASEPPSEKMMSAVEELIRGAGHPADFRRDLVARIGAFALDHPNVRPDFRTLFPDLLGAVKRDFFSGRRAEVESHLLEIVASGSSDERALSAEARARADRTVGNLVRRAGYCERCAREAADWLRRHLPPVDGPSA